MFAASSILVIWIAGIMVLAGVVLIRGDCGRKRVGFGVVVCPNTACRHANKRGATFCSRCGRAIESSRGDAGSRS